MKYISIDKVLDDKISGEWGLDPEDDFGVKIIRTANFTNLGVIDFSKIVHRKIEQKKIDQKRLILGDVIIEKSGGSPTQPVGRVVYFENPDNSIYLCNNFTTVLRPNKAIVFPKFLFYVLFYNHLTKKTLRFQNKTTGIINLKLENYLKSEIPLPPIDDQIRIAAILTRVENLIAKRKESIKALDELLKSTFLEMFGDPVNMHNQPKIKFGEVIVFLTSGSRGWAQYYSETGKIFLRINNVRDAYLKLDDIIYVNPPNNAEALRTKVQKNDLLLSITADLGRTSVVTDALNGAFINQHLALIRLKQKEVNPLYIAWFFVMPFGKSIIMKKNRIGVKAGLNFDDIRCFELIVPPLALQNKFAGIVEKVEGMNAKYAKSLEELENLYGSLSQKAFKGELDLSNVPLE